MAVKYGINREERRIEQETMEDEMAKRLTVLWPLSLLTVAAILAPFFMVAGCSSTQKHPNRAEPYEKIPFSEILRSPEQCGGKVVKLGGLILDVVNKEEGSTLEILEQPLNWRDRPKVGDVSGGRFKVVFQEFLDKEVYRTEKPITVVGEIVGTEKGLIGETVYNYPLLSGREIRLWEEDYPVRPRIHIGIGGGGGHVGGGVGISF
jgi:outer membrane lipoprotein